MSDETPTPTLADFRARYRENHNAWWELSSGHHQNLFEEALEWIEFLEAELRRVVPKSGMVLDLEAQEDEDGP